MTIAAPCGIPGIRAAGSWPAVHCGVAVPAIEDSAMDILGTVFASVLGGACTKVGYTLYDRIKQRLNDLFKDDREARVVEMLEQIGNLADLDIVKRVEELTEGTEVPPEDAEEFKNLLIN